jgi:hypothetical protein
MTTPPQPAPADLDAALAADAAALQRRNAAQRHANAEPLPGPLAQAFGFWPAIGEVRVRPVVAGDFVVFKEMDSPLYRRTFDLAEHARLVAVGERNTESAPPGTKFTGDECTELLYQFITPLPVFRAGLQRGRAHLRQHAIKTIATRVPNADIEKLFDLVLAGYTTAFSTAINYQLAAEADTETTVFFAEPGARDGLGWWLRYVAALLSAFNFSLNHVLDELPLAQGFALLAWHWEQQPDAVAVSPRYIAQETAARLDLGSAATPATPPDKT